MQEVDESLVTSKQVRARIGGVSAMCVWRWTRDGKFPKPVRINGRNYWRSGVIRAWIMAQGADANDHREDAGGRRSAAVHDAQRRFRERPK